MWVNLNFEYSGQGYTGQAKVFAGSSEWGIGQGRVSKLFLRTLNGDDVLNYDRGWDVKPDDARLIDVATDWAVLEFDATFEEE